MNAERVQIAEGTLKAKYCDARNANLNRIKPVFKLVVLVPNKYWNVGENVQVGYTFAYMAMPGEWVNLRFRKRYNLMAKFIQPICVRSADQCLCFERQCERRGMGSGFCIMALGLWNPWIEFSALVEDFKLKSSAIRWNRQDDKFVE